MQVLLLLMLAKLVVTAGFQASQTVGLNKEGGQLDCRFWKNVLMEKKTGGHLFYWWDETSQQCRACSRCHQVLVSCSRSVIKLELLTSIIRDGRRLRI